MLRSDGGCFKADRKFYDIYVWIHSHGESERSIFRVYAHVIMFPGVFDTHEIYSCVVRYLIQPRFIHVWVVCHSKF